jgi:hypothetical protein
LDHGVRVRVPLEVVVRDYLGANDPLIDEIRRANMNTENDERDLAFGTAMLERYERLLRNHFDEILRLPLDVIFPHEKPTWGIKGFDWG